jgi:hypothetical protein
MGSRKKDSQITIET